MKVFVTGGAGFIGSCFVRHILSLRQGHGVVNYDKLTYAGNLANLASVEREPCYRFIKGDICDPEAVEVAMEGCDAVVHFAAESHVDRSIYDPGFAIETNVKGTFVLLQAGRKLNILKFVHVSTDEVYGDIAEGEFCRGEFTASPQQSILLLESSVGLTGACAARRHTASLVGHH